MESWVVNSMSLANQNTCWDIGDSEEVLKRLEGQKQLEDLLKIWYPTTHPNKAMDQLNRLPFLESPSSTRTPTIRSLVYCLGHLCSHDVCVTIALIFLSLNLCHSTHICSYLNSNPYLSDPLSLLHLFIFILSMVHLSYLYCDCDQIRSSLQLD